LPRQQLEQDGAATIEASDASVNRRPCRLSVPIDMRCQTIELTPAMPSNSPATLRGAVPPEEQRGQTGREYRIGADDETAEAGGDGLQPGIAEAEIKRVVRDTEKREYAGVSPRQRAAIAAQRPYGER
jgi:hypothetical protein